MKYLAIIGLFVSLHGYGKSSQLEARRKYFELITGHSTSYIPIYMGTLQEGNLAQCRWTPGNLPHQRYRKHIIVNRLHFNKLSRNWQIALIAHELLHCHLHLDHTDHLPRPDLLHSHLPVDTHLSSYRLLQMIKKYKK